MMDALFATFERLRAGLGTQDGAASANAALRDLHYPQLSSLLPYRYVDGDSGLFINRGSIGFLLEARPLTGANEHIVQVLDDVIIDSAC
jgi:conjugal transfer ATP-binding protein TraC